MDFLIEFLGRDRAIMLALFIGVTIRANLPTKAMPLTALKDAFTQFFIVLCLLYMMEAVVEFFDYQMAAKAMISIAGISGWMGSWWVAGFKRDGKEIVRRGSAASLLKIAQSIGDLLFSFAKKVLNLK